MKNIPAARIIILCAWFLMCATADHARALNFLSRTKNVSIDAHWRITGHYTCEFEITHPDDIRTIHHMTRRYAENPDLCSGIFTEIRLADGQTLPWRGDEDTVPPAGAVVCLKYSAASAFPGFDELFADSMHIEQDVPVKTAAYNITFPQKTIFVYRIDQDGQRRENHSQAESFAWSGHGIRRLDILISTATSWEPIVQRYQAHFQRRLGNGLSVTDIPESLRSIDKNYPSAEKIQAVMNFLKTDLAYQTSSTPAHALLPDAPATVLHRGWGDCKDLALLGTALLQQMNIEAFVVLTGTPRAHLKDEAIPDPFIFDHALIGISENGRPIYYDCLGPEGTVALNDQQVYLPLEVSCNAPQ